MAKPILNAPDNGIPHRSLSGQLSSALPVGTATTQVTLGDGSKAAVSGNALALMLAAYYESITTNADAFSDKLTAHADEMLNAVQSATIGGVIYHGKAELIIVKYDKGYVEQSMGDAPASMRTSPVKTLAGGRSIMQPGRVVSPIDTYTSWGQWHPHMRTKPQLDGVNGRYATDPYRGVWMDTMGPESTQGQVWWTGNPLGRPAGSMISDADWNTLGAASMAIMQSVLGADVYLAANGVRGGGIADPFAAIADWADQCMWEGWLDFGIRNNLIDRLSDAQFVSSVNAALAVQQAGKNFEGLCYFDDSVATSVIGGGTPLRKAQEYEVAIQLLASNGANGGHLTHQMAVGSGDPWLTGEMTNRLYQSFRAGTSPYASSRLGLPVDHYWDVTSQRVVSDGGLGRLYKRKYANGYVLVNTSQKKALTYSVSAAQKDLFTGTLVGMKVTVSPGAAKFTVTA